MNVIKMLGLENSSDSSMLLGDLWRNNIIILWLLNKELSFLFFTKIRYFIVYL
jgi:hypothetical protein